MITTQEYVVMNNQLNEAPRSYSLNVPNTPPGAAEVPQKPLELPHKQEAPRVAPKPSRPPKKSVLLSVGGRDVSPPHGISPPHSGAAPPTNAPPTNAPPIPVKKKNSLHRRKGLAVYDQPDGDIGKISQQFESTSLSHPQPTQVQTSSHNDLPYTVDTAPVAPVTMAPDHDTTKPVSYPSKTKCVQLHVLCSYHLDGMQRWTPVEVSFTTSTETWVTPHGVMMKL